MPAFASPLPDTRPWKAHVWVGVIWTLLSLVVFHEGLLGWAYIDGSSALWGHDALLPAAGGEGIVPTWDRAPGDTMQAWDWWAMQQWRSGQWPGWIPHNGLGIPLWANGQSGIFNPFKWLLVWDASGPGYAWFLWSRLCFAAWGCLVLGRALGFHAIWSGVLAAGFAWSAPMLLHFPHPDVHVQAALPWLVWLGLRLGRNPSGPSAALFGCAVGWVGGWGHAEAAIFAAMAAGFGSAATAWVHGQVWRWLPWAGGGVVVAILVGSPAWLPFLAWTQECVSYHQEGAGLRGILRQDWPLSMVLVALIKHGLWPLASPSPAWFNPYVGAWAGALWPWAWRSERETKALLISLAGLSVGALLLFEPSAPWPWLPMGPNVQYLPPIWALGLALAAAAGGQALSHRPSAWAALLPATLVLLAWAMLRWPAAQPVAQTPELWRWWPWAGALLSIALLLAWFRQRPRDWRLPPLWSAFFALGMALELALWARAMVPPLAHGGFPVPIGWQSSLAKLGHERSAAAPTTAMRPNRGSAWGVRQWELLDAWLPRRFVAYARQVGPTRFPTQVNPIALKPKAKGWQDLTAVRWVVTPSPPGAWRLQEQPSALPRARWVAQAVVVPPALSSNLLATQAPENWRSRLWVEDAGATEPKRWVPPTATPLGPAQVRWVKDEAQALAWEVEAPQEGWLVVADQWARGWRASMDGQELKIWPAYHTMRAVQVPAGHHLIQMRYAPSLWPTSLALAACGGLAAGLMSRLPRRRKKAPPLSV